MVTYVLKTPATIGTLGAQQIVTELALTGLRLNLKPELAALGAGELDLTLTDTKSGAQEKICYKDTGVPALLAAPQANVNGMTLGDILARAIFEKLIADGKLPEGTLS